MKKGYILRTLALAACLCMLLSGCGGSVIAEDRYQDGLPLLDPEDGVAKDVTVELYYRLTGEPYLVPVTRNISVRANERTETAIIRTLLEGVPQQSLSANVSGLFPPGTSIVEVSLDSGILYVTLSAEFLDEAIVEAARRTGSAFGSYEAALQRAEKELYLSRKLGVYSLVNTLTGYGEGDMRVQILVDENDTGKGTRLPGGVLGLDSREGAASELMEPLEFNADAVATPERIVDCMLAHMVGGEFEMAYALFMEAAVGGAQKPTYANFETEMLSLGNITAYTVNAWNEAGDGTASVTVDLEFKAASGEARHILDAEILLKREGDLYKIGYGSFKSLLEAA